MQIIFDRYVLKAESLGYLIEGGGSVYSDYEATHRKNRSIIFKFNKYNDPLDHNADRIIWAINPSVSGIGPIWKTISIDEFEMLNPVLLEELHQQMTTCRSNTKKAKQAFKDAVNAESKAIQDLIAKF